MKSFSNAPLPILFENEAIISPDGSEFALPAHASKLYVNWCYENNMNLIGFDVWLAGPTDNTKLDEFSTKGNLSYCLSEMDCLLNHPDILKYNRGILFNLWIDY